jgi:hypothetical protein
MSHPLRIQEFDHLIEKALADEEPIVTQHEVARFAPPATRDVLPPLPSYVEHRDDVELVGKAAAQAIVQQYEGATKALEAMGKELMDCVKQNLEMNQHAIAAVAFITETCEAYREQAKAMFVRIEHCSALTSEVHKVCEEMRQKIAK